MPIRTVGEYLKRWGYTPQRPTRQALEQKPWDVQRWLQEGYPLIASKAKQEDSTVYWADETAYRTTKATRSSWCSTTSRRTMPKKSPAWIKAHEREIEVFYLPPYAPQSNPDEYLNRDFKTQLRSADRCTTPSGLLAKAVAFMQFLVSSPKRVKSYFQHDSVVYAA